MAHRRKKYGFGLVGIGGAFSSRQGGVSVFHGYPSESGQSAIDPKSQTNGH
jgi:hypothetical protein